MTEPENAQDAKAAEAPVDRPLRCDHICLKDDGHVERGEPHFYGYELPSPRAQNQTEQVLVATDVSYCVTHGATDHDGKKWEACRFRQLFYFENPMDEHTVEWAGAMTACEFCSAPAPADQFHPYWHDEGSPMVACGACVQESPAGRPEVGRVP